MGNEAYVQLQYEYEEIWDVGEDRNFNVGPLYSERQIINSVLESLHGELNTIVW